jgi:predicted DNA-binding transcriptional regulator YafY
VVRFSKASADYIREKRWHPSQVVTELPDGRLELRMKISSLAEVQRWILSWGGHATAVAPAELRDMVASAARAIVEGTVDR